VSGAPPSLTGAQLGAYRIECLLGEGGMARVYRGADPSGQPVAVKVVRSKLARDKVFRRRFEREARVAREIRSSALVGVLDSGEHEGTPYLVQEFMSGGSLEARLERDRRLALDETLRVADRLADGLAALGAAGIVHRDVKPGNVLFDAAGRASLADFGLVRDAKGTVLTRVGQTLGSPHYMAPEQIRGEEVTSATDVYSLACLLYECLSGGSPFADQRGMQVLWSQLTGIPPSLADAPPEVSVAVLAGMAKEPTERPGSAIAYVATIRRAAGIEPV